VKGAKGLRSLDSKKLIFICTVPAEFNPWCNPLTARNSHFIAALDGGCRLGFIINETGLPATLHDCHAT